MIKFKEFIYEGYSTMVLRMRLDKLVNDIIEQIYNIIEESEQEDRKIKVHNDLSKVRKKYKDINFDKWSDLLLNANPNYNISEIFDLNNKEFIEELDIFLQSMNNWL